MFFVFQSDKDFDPFADKRRPTIADREDEYRQKRRRMIISPERIDPFADGECIHKNETFWICLVSTCFKLFSEI